MSKSHSLWVEKYRSNSLQEFVGNPSIKESINLFIEQNDIQNLLFYGPAGTGKTTLAKLIVDNINCDHLYINASDERGIDTIRDKVVSFASAASFTPLKVVILDEADFLTLNAQASLRNVIETFSRSTRFILTCNFVERIIDPIQSRCQTFKILPPSKSQIASHVMEILEKEDVKVELNDLKILVNQFYPDLRKMLNTAQAFSKTGTLVLDTTAIASSNYMFEVLKELKSKPNFKKIRQIIQDSNVSDYEGFYRFLYDNASEYASGKEGTIAILLNKYAYEANFKIDKEINLMALISEIITHTKPQVI